mgnify:CR=1 FL=1|jgi:hypothetical protein
MKIVIVGGGTAGWMAALMISSRHPEHHIEVIESTKIGVVGVGESTTGLLSDLLNNHLWDFGCDHNEFIAETGASIKYGIKFTGWTPNTKDYYIGPIDGSYTKEHTPDVFFAYGASNLSNKDIVKVSETGNMIHKGMTNFDLQSGQFNKLTHAMHVDAHLVGKYFQKVTLRKPNTSHIDAKVVDADLDEKGFMKNVMLENGTKIDADFFIDCSGFARLLISKMPGSDWVSFKDNLPVNAGLPFLLDYKEGERPQPHTHAWAQDAGWMWQIPLLDRIGNGYVFCDDYITPDQAHQEVEQRLGRKIEPQRVIKFDTGRQKSSWINNCLAIGLSSAFLEPLEATSIHSTLVQIKNFAFDYLRVDMQSTLNKGTIDIYNHRTRKMFDDFKDFLVMHYMGGRTDTEFWKYISSGATKTDFVDNLIETSKVRLPSINDFPKYYGAAGWPLYSYVMHGLNLYNRDVATQELMFNAPGLGGMYSLVEENYLHMQQQWDNELSYTASWEEMIDYYRQLRKNYV